MICTPKSGHRFPEFPIILIFIFSVYFNLNGSLHKSNYFCNDSEKEYAASSPLKPEGY